MGGPGNNNQSNATLNTADIEELFDMDTEEGCDVGAI
jgi:hypothetical protein